MERRGIGVGGERERIENSNMCYKDKEEEVEKTKSLQRERKWVCMAKNDKLAVKLPLTILPAQSTFQKPTEIQSGLLSESKEQAFLSSS